jgi:hypothetical protein
VTLQRISGHRDGDQTSCPGDVLYAQLGDLRGRAAGYAGPVSAITVRASSQRVRGTVPVSLSGTLRFADGSSPAGALLDVEYTTAGSAWTKVGETVCAADGTWATTVALPASGQVRAAFPGDGTRPRLESSPFSVTVIPTLTLALAPRRAPAGSRVAVSGTLLPSEPRVQCVLERRVGSRWITVQRKRVSVRGGSYSTFVRPRTPGLYRVSVLATGTVRRRTLRALRR